MLLLLGPVLELRVRDEVVCERFANREWSWRRDGVARIKRPGTGCEDAHRSTLHGEGIDVEQRRAAQRTMAKGGSYNRDGWTTCREARSSVVLDDSRMRHVMGHSL